MPPPAQFALGDGGVTVCLHDWSRDAGEVRSDALDDVGFIPDDGFSVTFQRKYEIHGGFEPGSDDDATLLVLKIIPTAEPGRVFKRLRVELVFEKANPDDDDLKIVAFEPGQEGEQKFGEHVTNVTKETNSQLSLAAEAPPASAGASISRSVAEESQRRKLHKLSAGSRRSTQHVSKKNLVWWELEAAEESNGVGDYVVVAVLIQRAPGSKFRIRADTKAGFEGFKNVFDKIRKQLKKRETVCLDLWAHQDPERIPDSVSKNELHAVSMNNLLQTFAYVHIPEQVALKTLYEQRTTDIGASEPSPSSTLTQGMAQEKGDEPDIAPAPDPKEQLLGPSTQSAVRRTDAANQLLSKRIRERVFINNHGSDGKKHNPDLNARNASQPSTFPSTRAIRHLKMAALYERLAELHREEADETLVFDETTYADQVCSPFG